MTTYAKSFGVVPFAGPRSLGKPAATFPGAVAGDAQLAVAVDREQTRLALPLSAADTSMTVQNAAGLAVWSLLSIENEIVQVNGALSGNVVPIRRGFDGTTAALHLTGATVAGLIDAYHHNTLVAEIEAIETALGANLANLSGTQLLLNTSFQFAPLAPGGALAAGANVVTLTPVPKGVNGGDVNHYLYVSGGTGAAEAALIIGGTAVSGAASGTVIIQCANTHSGAWTIQSATAGIQEGYQTLVTSGTGGTLYISPQTNTVYTGIMIAAANITLAGVAASASIIKAANNANINGKCMIQLTNTATGFNLLNCVIDGNRDNTGINPTQSLPACVLIGAGNCQIVNCEIRNSPMIGLFIGDNGIAVDNVIVHRCYFHHNGRMDGNGGSMSGFGGVGIQTGGNLRTNNLRITNSKFIHNHNGVVQPGDGCGVNLSALAVVVANNYFQDNFNVGGGQIVGAVADASGAITNVEAGWSVVGNVVCCTTTFGTPADVTDGIEIAMRGFSIAGNAISGVSRYGIDINGVQTGNGSVTGNTIFNVDQGMACLPMAGTSVDHVLFADNSVNARLYAFATNTNHTYISVKNNILIGGTLSFVGNWGTGCEVVNNLVNRRILDPHNVTVSASPMTYTAGYTQEMVAIKGYTTLSVTYAGSGLIIALDNVANSTWTWLLLPSEVIHIQYSGTPTMTVVPLD